MPYQEGSRGLYAVGENADNAPLDRSDLHLSEAQLGLIRRTRKHCNKLLVILLSGRPLIITEELESWDAFVAA